MTARAVALVENVVVMAPEPAPTAARSTPIVPPSSWFPGVMHFDAGARQWAIADARAVIQAEQIRPDGVRCIEVARWP